MQFKGSLAVAFFILLLFLPTIHQTQTANAGSFYYRDYDTFITDFKNLTDAHPSLISYKVVGKTVLNQDILMFTIGNLAADKVLFDGAIHGEETLGSELLLDYAKWLLTSNDPLAERILTRTCTLLIPGVNVDNFNYLRVNAHHVDLNRNFATNWGSGGDSNSTSWEYRGPSSLSEPEAQTLINVFNTYTPRFYVNLHSFGGAYYLGSDYGNKTLYASLINQINTISQQRGVTSYPNYWTGGAGFAISDAAKLGITSFLLELTSSTTIPLSGIGTTILPKFLPIAIALSKECESSKAEDNILSDAEIRIIRADNDSSFFIQTQNLYDSQAIGYFYSSCLNSQNQRLMDDPLTVAQTGPDVGKPEFSNKSTVIFGGPLAHNCSDYYEKTGQTPLLFTKTAYGADQWGFIRKDGSTIANASINVTASYGHSDIFLMETFNDNNGNFVVVVYGVTQYGTLAAGPYFHATILPNFSLYTSTWYVFSWQDGTNGQPFDSYPQPAEISLVTNGV